MGTSRIIRRWTTDFLSTDGRDVCVEWVAGDSSVIVLDDDAEISSHEIPLSADIGDFAVGLLEVLELARLKSWHDSLAENDERIDRIRQHELDETWAAGPTDEELEAVEEYNAVELELGGEG